MGDSTPFPSAAAIARAELLTRERFVYEGETLEDALAPGSARRRALDSALAEVEAGAKQPSLEWRRQYSLLLGLERVLSEDEPHLVDGTVLSAHQVDALSGTLTALLAAVQMTTASNGRGALAALPAPQPSSPEIPADIADDDDDGGDDDGGRRARGRRDRRGRGARGLAGRRRGSTRTSAEGAPDDPGADRRFWFEHATGAGKTVAALGFVEASRTGGVLILTHRRNLVDQFIGELSDRGYRDRICAPLLDGP